MNGQLNAYLAAAVFLGLALAPLASLAALLRSMLSGNPRFLQASYLAAGLGTGVWIIIFYWHFWTGRIWPAAPMAASLLITWACGWHARPQKRGRMFTETLGLFAGGHVLLAITSGAFSPLAQRTYAQGRVLKKIPELRSSKDAALLGARLAGALEDDERNVRWGAAIELRYRRLFSPLTVRALARRLADPDPDVRRAADRALYDVDPIPAEALPELLESFDRTLHDEFSRYYHCPQANQYLSKIGSPAVPELEKRLQSKDPSAAECAGIALKAISRAR